MRASALVLALAAIVAASRAQAQVTLHRFGILDGPRVRLSDLFRGTGQAGRRVLGPGPDPGQEIVVPAAQLAAIATEFGVAWRPRSQDERVILERPGRPLRRGEARAALTPALRGVGAPAQPGVIFSRFPSLEVPPGVRVVVRVHALDFDPISERFSAVLAVSAKGMDTLEAAVSGRVEPMARVLLATRFLGRGAILDTSDLKQSEVPQSSIERGVARTLQEAEGLELTRAVPAGAPIVLADLRAPPLVRRGERVIVALTVPGLSLTEEGRALEAGALGAEVRVLNPGSHALLEATVRGPGEVSVARGSLPLRPPVNGSRRPYASYPDYPPQ